MRRLITFLLVVVLVAAAGYTGYWFYIARQLRAGLEPWAEARRAEGYTVRWEAAAVEGFPAAFRLRFQQPVFGAPMPTPYEVSGASIVGEAAPWNLRRWHVSLPQGAHVAAPVEAASLTLADLAGDVTLSGAGGAQIDVTAHEVAGGEAAAGLRVGTADARIAIPDKPAANHRETGLGIAVSLTQLALPHAVAPFGGTVETLALAATLKGALPHGPLARSLEAWRDDGGTIELENGRLRWGDLAVDASGTLALDEALQPTGALTATIRGHNALVDAVTAAGGLQPRDANVAKIFLGLMAKPGPDGQNQLTLPLSLQDDRLYLGPAQIASLPRVTWH
jgi:hypothetical protein